MPTRERLDRDTAVELYVVLERRARRHLSVRRARRIGAAMLSLGVAVGVVAWALIALGSLSTTRRAPAITEPPATDGYDITVTSWQPGSPKMVVVNAQIGWATTGVPRRP